MSEADKFGTREEPVMSRCAKCGDPTPLADLNADDWCSLCASIDRLRATLEKRGIVKPDLFDNQHSQLPPSDR